MILSPKYTLVSVGEAGRSGFGISRSSGSVPAWPAHGRITPQITQPRSIVRAALHALRA